MGPIAFFGTIHGFQTLSTVLSTKNFQFRVNKLFANRLLELGLVGVSIINLNN